MELLTRQVDRVGVLPPAGPRHPRPHLRAAARPLPPHPGPGDRLRHGLRGGRRAPGRAGPGRADRPRWSSGYQRVAARVRHRAVLGSDFAGTNLPGRAGRQRAAGQRVRRLRHPGDRRPGPDAPSPWSPRSATPTTPTRNLGCDVIAMIANRVARRGPADGDRRAAATAPPARCPCYVLPDEPALSAPTVAADRRGARTREVLLGDDAGLSRDALDFVFGGAMLPNFLRS